MNFDLVHIWQQMDLFARLVVLSLAIMAISSLSIFVERLWYFQRARSRSDAFGARATQLIASRSYEGVVKEGAEVVGSPLATLLTAGLKTFAAAQHKPDSKLSPVELTRRELARKTDQLAADVRRGFNLLASVGSVAPFVGLLGTVVGIIASFQGIAREGSGGIGAVSAGISEALIVTAFGLLVAIPSVLAFNFLSGKADALTLALDQAKGELIDHLESEGPHLRATDGRSNRGPAADQEAVHAT